MSRSNPVKASSYQRRRSRQMPEDEYEDDSPQESPASSPRALPAAPSRLAIEQAPASTSLTRAPASNPRAAPSRLAIEQAPASTSLIRRAPQAVTTTDETDAAREKECPICSDDFTDPVFTPCAHRYCYECLKTWLSTSNECPTCRKVCDFSEVFNEPPPSMGFEIPAASPAAALLPAPAPALLPAGNALAAQMGTLGINREAQPRAPVQGPRAQLQPAPRNENPNAPPDDAFAGWDGFPISLQGGDIYLEVGAGDPSVTCSVCTQRIVREYAMPTICDHHFHRNCLDAWRHRTGLQAECPTGCQPPPAIWD